VGLLHYLLRKFDPVHGPDLAFVPVGINYDRVVEDRNLIPGAPDERRSARRTVSAAIGRSGRIALLVARGGSVRLGAACVTFGVPISVREALAASGKDLRTLPGDEYRAEVKRIAATIMGAVASAIPATPVAVMCRALLTVGFEDVDEGTVLDEVARLAAELSSRPGILVSPRRSADLYREAIRVLTRRQVVTVGDETLTVASYDRPLLEYYANSISHHFDDGRAASPR
jgi:glycerol-3-phosphate O-acyltransferase